MRVFRLHHVGTHVALGESVSERLSETLTELRLEGVASGLPERATRLSKNTFVIDSHDAETVDQKTGSTAAYLWTQVLGQIVRDWAHLSRSKQDRKYCA